MHDAARHPRSHECCRLLCHTTHAAAATAHAPYPTKHILCSTAVALFLERPAIDVLRRQAYVRCNELPTWAKVHRVILRRLLCDLPATGTRDGLLNGATRGGVWRRRNDVHQPLPRIACWHTRGETRPLSVQPRCVSAPPHIQQQKGCMQHPTMWCLPCCAFVCGCTHHHQRYATAVTAPTCSQQHPPTCTHTHTPTRARARPALPLTTQHTPTHPDVPHTIMRTSHRCTGTRMRHTTTQRTTQADLTRAHAMLSTPRAAGATAGSTSMPALLRCAGALACPPSRAPVQLHKRDRDVFAPMSLTQCVEQMVSPMPLPVRRGARMPLSLQPARVPVPAQRYWHRCVIPPTMLRTTMSASPSVWVLQT